MLPQKRKNTVDFSDLHFIIKPSMIKRGYTAGQGLVRYWAHHVLDFWQSVEAARFTDQARELVRALEALQPERRVMVIGAPRSGKSSVAAGLLGSELPLRAPVTGACVRWRFRCSDGDLSDSRFLPKDELEGLEVVDTADCADAVCAERIESLFPRTDVLIATLDCRTMESSPCWEMLQKAEGKVGAVILAITFTDLAEKEELLRIKGSIRLLCRDRLKMRPVALLVSPNEAESREAFAESVQEALDGPDGVRKVIRAAGQAAATLNKSICDVLDNRARVMSSNVDFLNGIETEISNFRSHQMAALKTWVENFVSTFESGRPRLLRRLRFSFGFFYSPVTLLRLDCFARATELAAYRSLVSELWQNLEEADARFVASCEAHWRSVRPRMLAGIDYELGDFPEKDLSTELLRVRSNLVRSLYRPFSDYRLQQKLRVHFKSCAAWMMNALRLICLAVLVAGLFGYFGQTAVATACLCFAALVWGAATLGHWLALRRICRDVTKDLEAFSPVFASAITGAIEEFLLSRVAAYRQLYNSPRMRIAHYEKTLAPLRARYPFLRDQLSAAFHRL